MLLTAATLLMLSAVGIATPVEVAPRACPSVHVFGARATTESSGFGSSAPVVNQILSAYPGSTSEAINYPACGGGAACGGVSYANSVIQGLTAVANQVNSFNAGCPNTKLVLVGYSQVSSLSDTRPAFPFSIKLSSIGRTKHFKSRIVFLTSNVNSTGRSNNGRCCLRRRRHKRRLLQHRRPHQRSGPQQSRRHHLDG